LLKYEKTLPLLTLITSFGIKSNKYSGSVQKQVTLKELMG